MVTRTTGYKQYESPFKIILEEQSRLKNEARKKVRSSLYASDYLQCVKKVFMQFHPERYPPETGIDGRTARIFANGEDVHVRLGNYLRESDHLGFKDEINVPRDDLDIHGRCDGIVRLNGQTYILEFKSINKPVVYEAKQEHIGQLTYYMHLFEQRRKELRKSFGLSDDQVIDEGESIFELKADDGRSFAELNDVDKDLLLSFGPLKGEIIYESKANQGLYHFSLDYDEEKAKEVLMWFKQMKEYIEKDELPVVKYDSRKFPCFWKTGRCDFWQTCYGRQETLSNVVFGRRKDPDDEFS